MSLFKFTPKTLFLLNFLNLAEPIKSKLTLSYYQAYNLKTLTHPTILKHSFDDDLNTDTFDDTNKIIVGTLQDQRDFVTPDKINECIDVRARCCLETWMDKEYIFDH